MALTNNQIHKALSTKDPMTATALAKKLGMTKAREGFKSQLGELVLEGLATENIEGRYALYLKAPAGSSQGTTVISKVPFGKTKTTAIGTPTNQPNVPALPEAAASLMKGYSITKSKKKKNAKVIKTPNGKKITMNDDDFLIVINNEPLYVVKDPADAMTCIHEYRVDKGMRTCVVSDIVQSKSIGTSGDIEVSETNILFLEIKKHNKAA